MASTERIPGIGPALCAALADIGMTSTQDLAAADVARLTQLRGISAGRAEAFIAAAKSLSQEEAEVSAADPGSLKKAGKKKARKEKGDKAAVKAEPSVKKTKDKKKKKSDKAKAKTKAARKSKK